MDKECIITLLSGKMKLIRIESGYTQDQMATVLGISKKTLVQIEKGRILAGWVYIVALVALFRNSEILESILGDSPMNVIEMLAHKHMDTPKKVIENQIMDNRICWSDLEGKGKYRIQQHIVSRHYRIIDNDDYSWYSSFNHEETKERMNRLAMMEQ